MTQQKYVNPGRDSKTPRYLVGVFENIAVLRNIYDDINVGDERTAT